MAIVDELIAILGYEIRGEAKLKQFDKGLDHAAANVQKLTNRIVMYSAAADKAFNASRSMAIPSALAVVYAKRIKDASLKTTGWGQAFNAITGSVDNANKEIAKAADWADRYGANMEKVTDNWVKFKAATKGTDVAADAEEIFKTFTAVSVTLGQGPDQLDGALKAVEQMVSKGKVQAEELRGQLGERVYGAFIKAAEAMGITTAELDKMLEQGQVVASDLLPKLAKQLQEDYKLDLSKSIESDIATFQRLENSLFMLRVSIARSGFIDFLADLAQGMTKLVRRIADAPPWVQKLIASLITLVAVSAPLLWIFGAIARSISVILKAALAIRTLAAAFGILGAAAGGKKLTGFLSFFRKNKGIIKAMRLIGAAAAFMSAPILATAAAIAALGLGLNDLWHFLTGGESLIGALGEQLMAGNIGEFGEKIGTAIVEGIFFAFSKLHGAVDRFDELVNDPAFWKMGGEILKNIVNGLLAAVFILGASFAKVAGGIFWGIVNALLGFDAKEQLTLLVTDLIETIVNAWNKLVNFYDMGVQMVSQLFEGMKSIGGKIKSWFADLVPDWAKDFIGNGGDLEAQANNLAGNLNRTQGGGNLSAGSISNSNTRNNQSITNSINIEQNVNKPTDAPGQLAKAAGSALANVMPNRSQLQAEPAQP